MKVKFKNPYDGETTDKIPEKILGYIQWLDHHHRPQDLFHSLGWLVDLCPVEFSVSLNMEAGLVFLRRTDGKSFDSWILIEFERVSP